MPGRLTAFVIVPPRMERFDAPAYLARIEAALKMALPGYGFTVTTDHPARQDDDFYVDPNGLVNNMAVIEVIASTLVPFIHDKPRRLN